MKLVLSSRPFILTLLTSLLLFQSSEAIFKQIFGAALLGNLKAAFSSLSCVSRGNNFTNFMLYTRNKPDTPSVLIPNDWNSLQKSDFDSSVPTKVIIHGFVDGLHLSDWIMKMKSALLREGDYNVIYVDWSCGNGFPYFQAVENAKITATSLGDLLLFLMEARGANPADFHLIGHSLGSQIAGLVGHRIQHMGRISALDPAGPKFYSVPLEQRLDPSDALFVDVIHTDGGSGLFEGLGLYADAGHVDFYPNGGQTQPGCHSSPFDVLQRVGLQRAARYYLTCDHYRSVHFYIESIEQNIPRLKNGKGPYCYYVGVSCRDWKSFSEGRCADCSDAGKCAPMGFYSDLYPFRNSDEGAKVFYIKTSDDDPYCLFQYGVVFETGVSSRYRQAGANLSHDVIHLEIRTSSGRSVKLKLNERKEDCFRPGKKYVYLATSKYPVEDVKTALLWWGSEEKPRLQTSNSTSNFGFFMRKIEITPIMMHNLQNRYLEPTKIILCGTDSKMLRKNELLELSVNGC